jgi:hypothetical protein
MYERVVTIGHTIGMNEVAKSIVRTATEATATVVQTTVTAALAADLGPLALPAGAAAGALVKEIPILAQMVADRRRNATDMMEQAVLLAGITSEEFVKALTTDSKHRYLLRRAVQAASNSASDEKIRTLAAALADGAIACDDAVVDESVLVIDGVAQLEAVHLRVLALLATEPDPPDEKAQISSYAWSSSQVYKAVPRLAPVLDAVLAKLYALGMTDDLHSAYMNSWDDHRELTGYGRLCLRYVQALADEHPDRDRQTPSASRP